MVRYLWLTGGERIRKLSCSRKNLAGKDLNNSIQRRRVSINFTFIISIAHHAIVRYSLCIYRQKNSARNILKSLLKHVLIEYPSKGKAVCGNHSPCMFLVPTTCYLVKFCAHIPDILQRDVLSSFDAILYLAQLRGEKKRRKRYQGHRRRGSKLIVQVRSFLVFKILRKTSGNRENQLT